MLMNLALSCALQAAVFQLPTPLTLSAAQTWALEHAPGVEAFAHRREALRLEQEGEETLPSPEFMAEAWQVPFAQPWSLYDAQMLSLNLKQTFPGWGVREARGAVKAREGDVEAVRLTALEVSLSRDVGHAFVDLFEAELKHATHVRHEAVASRLVEVARARVSSGARLDELLMAERDLAKLRADVASEAAALATAQAKLAAYLGSEGTLPELALPLETASSTASMSTLIEQARRHRPERREAEARRILSEAEETSARIESSTPGFSVALGYYAPTRLMPVHGFGVSVGVELPWLWGGKAAMARARGEATQATTADKRQADRQLTVELASALGTVRAATTKWKSLKHDVLPAAERAFEGSLAAYRSGAGEVLQVLANEQLLVELEVELAMARSGIAHALVDLDAAMGGSAPREVLHDD